MYGVLIGLEIEGRCEVGAAYFPALDGMIYATTGAGCYRNGRRSRVSSALTLEGGILSFTDAASFEERGREEASGACAGPLAVAAAGLMPTATRSSLRVGWSSC